MLRKSFLVAAAAWFAFACQSTRADSAANKPAEGYQDVAERLQKLIEHELRTKAIPACSIALVDGAETVWSAGFGVADPQRQTPATAETAYRVGSVSKLFTDIAVMQLVERGELDLDAPVTDYLPEFQPRNPFKKPITLRQLMCHRAGLVREPPVGNYFDPTEPSLADTVRSLNRTALVYPPEMRIKYSNAGVGVVGYVLEKTQREPFAEYLDKAVLRPLAMRHSGFVAKPKIASRLAKATMWAYDGRTFAAPTFLLGTSAAGNLYSTAGDLSRFLIALLNGGQIDGQTLLKPETLAQMWRLQFAKPADQTGYGLGFHVSSLDGRRRVSHAGAVYGFSTQLSALPEAKLGVAVMASKDVTNGVTRRIADYALRLLLAKRAGRPLPTIDVSTEIPPERAKQMEGRYSHGDENVSFTERNGRLFLRRGDVRAEVRSLGDDLVVDDAFGFGPRIERLAADTLRIDDVEFKRIPDKAPQPAPERWRGLIGEYGWDHNTLYILESQGQLYALIEWCFYYPLTEISADEFAFPDYGLYHGEKLRFQRDARGRGVEVNAAEVVFKRRKTGPEAGQTFRIEPLKPADELRKAALAAKPPEERGEFRQPDLVELTSLDPTIKLDIRYASTNNFMGEVFYRQPRAFMQRPAAEAVVRAHRALRKLGFGLLIHDAYRPWFVTKMFYDGTPANMKHFVANPARGSRHNRGAAVDLTLYELKTGRPVEMTAGYDEFSTRSYPDYPGGTSLQRWRREVLRDAMYHAGFTIYEFEWWHFDFRDWRKYPILNLRFEQLAAQGK